MADSIDHNRNNLQPHRVLILSASTPKSLTSPSASSQPHQHRVSHRPFSIQYPPSSIQYRASSIQHPASNIQYPMPNTQCPISNIYVTSSSAWVAFFFSLPSLTRASRILSMIPLIKAPDSSVPNFFPTSTASLMDTFGGISSQYSSS